MVKDEKITMKELHTHPGMQVRLEIDSNHVIIDKEAYWRVYESLQTRDCPDWQGDSPERNLRYLT